MFLFPWKLNDYMYPCFFLRIRHFDIFFVGLLFYSGNFRCLVKVLKEVWEGGSTYPIPLFLRARGGGMMQVNHRGC